MAHGHVMQAACSVRGYSRSGAQLREGRAGRKESVRASAWRRPSRTIHCTVTLVFVPLVLHLSALSIALLLSFLYP